MLRQIIARGFHKVGRLLDGEGMECPNPVYAIKAFQQEPDLYNAGGEKVRVFYLRDDLCCHQPYSLVAGRMPQRILWDRYNYGLTHHFYSHSHIFDQDLPKCCKKYALLFESESIVPKDFEDAGRESGLMREYEAIFTHSARILNQYPNAKFLPASGVWYGTELNGGTIRPDLYEKKSKGISMVCSAKQLCAMHEVRQSIADMVKDNPDVDGYGKYFGNYVEKKSDALELYRYNIVVENDVTLYYFTEKILDCFASMTIPIYIGAEEIGRFFNPDGIISVEKSQIEQIPQILKQCTPQYYEEHLPAIRDNFERVQKYLCMEDYLMEHYKDIL